MNLPGYFDLFSLECRTTRTIDYSQNTVDGLQCMQFYNLICIFSVGQSKTSHLHVNVRLCGKLNVVQNACQIWLKLCHSSSFKPTESVKYSQQLNVFKGTFLGQKICDLGYLFYFEKIWTRSLKVT